MEAVRVIFLMILVTLGKLTERSSLFFLKLPPVLILYDGELEFALVYNSIPSACWITVLQRPC